MRSERDELAVQLDALRQENASLRRQFEQIHSRHNDLLERAVVRAVAAASASGTSPLAFLAETLRPQQPQLADHLIAQESEAQAELLRLRNENAKMHASAFSEAHASEAQRVELDAARRELAQLRPAFAASEAKFQALLQFLPPQSALRKHYSQELEQEPCVSVTLAQAMPEAAPEEQQHALSAPSSPEELSEQQVEGVRSIEAAMAVRELRHSVSRWRRVRHLRSPEHRPGKGEPSWWSDAGY